MKRVAVVIGATVAWWGLMEAVMPCDGALGPWETAAVCLSFCAVTCFNLYVACRP